VKKLYDKMRKHPVEAGKVKASERPFTALVSTFFFTGYLPWAPGSWGSLATVLLAYFLLPQSIAIQIVIVSIVFLVGVYVSKRAEEIYGQDGGPIVIDETAGMLVTLIAVPQNPIYYAIAFLAFRFFDIVKPFPARRSERIPLGWGVMADDIIAGIYGLAVMHLIVFLYQNLAGGL